VLGEFHPGEKKQTMPGQMAVHKKKTGMEGCPGASPLGERVGKKKKKESKHDRGGFNLLVSQKILGEPIAGVKFICSKWRLKKVIEGKRKRVGRSGGRRERGSEPGERR